MGGNCATTACAGADGLTVRTPSEHTCCPPLQRGWQLLLFNELLERSTRGGHSLANGHVARLAQEAGAKLLLNSDAHAPRDLMTRDFAGRVAEGAGLPRDALSALLSNAERLLERIGYAS